MARIRSIKPDFWEDFKLAEELTRDQRLLYIGLWNQADDEGRFLAHPRRLLGAVFPYDRDLQPQFIEDSLRTLADTGRVILYDVDGEPYAQLTKFRDHQRINRPTPSRIPPPPTTSPTSVNTHGGLTEGSPPPRAHVGAGSGAGAMEVEEETDSLASASGAKAPASFPQRSGRKDQPSAGQLMGMCRRQLYRNGRPPTGRSEDQDMNTITTLLEHGIAASDIAEAIEAAATMRDEGQCAFADPDDSLSMGALYAKPRQEAGWTKMPFWTEALEYHRAKVNREYADKGHGLSAAGDVLRAAIGR